MSCRQISIPFLCTMIVILLTGMASAGPLDDLLEDAVNATKNALGSVLDQTGNRKTPPSELKRDDPQSQSSSAKPDKVAAPPKKSPTVFSAPPPNPSHVRKVQRRLAELGLYHGNIDGDYGPATRKAIEDFQRQQGVQPNGELSTELVNHFVYKRPYPPETEARVAAPKKPAQAPLDVQAYRELEQRLKLGGWDTGPIDGALDPLAKSVVYRVLIDEGIREPNIDDPPSLDEAAALVLDHLRATQGPLPENTRQEELRNAAVIDLEPFRTTPTGRSASAAAILEKRGIALIGSPDGSMTAWSLMGSAPAHEIGRHKERVRGITTDIGEKRMVSWAGGEIVAGPIDAEADLRVMEPGASVDSIDLSWDGQQIVSSWSDGVLRVVHVGSPPASLGLGTSPLGQSADGEIITAASGASRLFVDPGGGPGAKRTLRIGISGNGLLAEEGDPALLSWAAQRAMLAVADRSGELWLLDWPGGEVRAYLPPTNDLIEHSRRDGSYTPSVIATAPDGLHIGVGYRNGRAAFWTIDAKAAPRSEAASGGLKSRLRAYQVAWQTSYEGGELGRSIRRAPNPPQRESSISMITFSPDSKRVLVGSEDGSIGLHDSETGSMVAQLHGLGVPVMALEFLASGSIAAGIGGDGSILFWRLP